MPHRISAHFLPSDSTHLAEFHQIEGLIADYDLTLADLIGVISQFFQKWGMCLPHFVYKNL